MKFIVAIAIVLCVSAVPVQRAAACSCMAVTPREAAAFADAVFTGTVVGQDPVVRGALPGDPVPLGLGEIRYTFAVDGVAKGGVGERAVVRAGGDGASCGVTFGSDERWLIFAALDGGALTTGLCSGNQPLPAGEAAPLPLVAPEASPEPDGGIPVGALLVVAIVVVATVGSAIVFRLADRPR